MKTIEKLLASAFEKVKKIDVLGSVLADCKSDSVEKSVMKNKCRPITCGGCLVGRLRRRRNTTEFFECFRRRK